MTEDDDDADDDGGGGDGDGDDCDGDDGDGDTYDSYGKQGVHQKDGGDCSQASDTQIYL